MNEDSRELIVGLNLYLLQTISQLAKSDIADAILCFGIGRDTAEKLAMLNPAQLYELSRSPSFMFVVDQERINKALKDRQDSQGYGSMHDEIVRISSLLRKEEDHA